MSRASQNANAVVRSVCDLLAAHKIWHMRIQTGGLMGATRFIRFGKKGAADILAVVKLPVMRLGDLEVWTMTPFWIEAKSGAGRQSSAQRAFQEEVEAEKHFYIIAHNGPEAVEAWLKQYGVIR